MCTSERGSYIIYKEHNTYAFYKMVQFGRRLVEERYPEWREFYIRYKELKNALYAEREDIEGGEKSGLFVKTLQAEIMKVRIILRVLSRGCCSCYLFVSFSSTASSEGIISGTLFQILRITFVETTMCEERERCAFSPFSRRRRP